MKNLIIDCSSGMKVYLIDEDKEYVKIDENQKKHTDELLVVIDELLNAANLKIDDIENLCVCIGPGSFTGIRVAISICKGLSVDSKMKVFVASNFEIIEDENEQNAVYVLEGFSKFLYVKIASKNDSIEECIAIDDFANKEKFRNCLIIAQNEKMQNLLKQYEIQSIIAKNNTIFVFNQKIKQNQSVNLNQIEPIYLRASQAEIERNARLSGVK